MLVEAKLPQKFWVAALNTAVHLHNRSPTKALDGKTPYEAWTGSKPILVLVFLGASHWCSLLVVEI